MWDLKLASYFWFLSASCHSTYRYGIKNATGAVCKEAFYTSVQEKSKICNWGLLFIYLFIVLIGGSVISVWGDRSL